jgi:hypothetical protein
VALGAERTSCERWWRSWTSAACSIAATPTRFITVVVAEEAEMDMALGRIEATLRRDPRWKVLAIHSRPVTRFESEVAMELVEVPRL